LTGISTSGGNYSFTYDNTGKRISLGFPNGIVTNYTYDSNSRLVNLVINNGRKVLSQYSYTHDNIGNRLTKTQDDTLYEYEYDAIYRLQTATVDLSLEESYGYDPVGNRLSGPVAGDSYSYNIGNQLTTDTDAQYIYDANGNMISKTTQAGTTVYLYDYENRLVQVTLPDATIVGMKYDPFGRRIEKSVNGVLTNYFYDQEDILFEYDGSGNPTNRYMHGPGIDEPLAVEMSGNTYYYHADGLGSVMFLTKSNRKIEETYSYDSFGRPQGGTIRQPYSYTGREWDAEIGLYYYRARYYDPEAGRFISRDPIGFEGGDVNLYGYVGNNAVNLIDPFGLESIIGGDWLGPSSSSYFYVPIGGTYHIGPGGGNVHTQFEFDTNGNFCISSTICSTAGWGFYGSFDFFGFGAGTGELCEGYSESVGAFHMSGAGSTRSGSMSISSEGEFATGKTILGHGGGKASGVSHCRVSRMCIK
jgi:RHS repeat-associated protein